MCKSKGTIADGAAEFVAAELSDAYNFAERSVDNESERIAENDDWRKIERNEERCRENVRIEIDNEDRLQTRRP